MLRYLPSPTTRLAAYIPDTATHRTVAALFVHVSCAVDLYFGSLTASVLPGRPRVALAGERITVHVSYFALASGGVNGTALTRDDVSTLTAYLSAATGLECSLVLVKLTQPYLDAQVLASYMSHELSAEDKFVTVLAALHATAHIAPHGRSNLLPGLPSYIIGVKVALAGRLKSEVSRPRLTDQVAQLGSLMTKPGTNTSVASHTAINAKGTYTVKVWLCQRHN